MASTIAEVSGSYAVATNGSGSPATATWGSGRVGSNTGNLLLAFTHTIFVTGVGGTQSLSGWTLAASSFSGNSKSALFYKTATSSDIPANTVSFTPTLLPTAFTVASVASTGGGTTQTYTTSGSGSVQPFTVGQPVTVTGAGIWNVTSATITAVGGSSGAWTFTVAGTTTGTSSTGTATYSPIVNRCQLSLYEVSGADASQFDITPLFTNNTTAGTPSGSSVVVGSSSTLHLAGGALGMLFAGVNSGYTTATFSIGPSGFVSLTHATNSTLSTMAGFYKFDDMTATDVGNAAIAFSFPSGTRSITGIYIAVRPLYAGSDTGSGVDTTDGFTWSLSGSDAPQAQGADTATSSMAIPVADGPQSNGTDTVSSLTVSLTGSDAGSGTDNLAIERGAFDTGSGAESVALITSSLFADSGTGVESQTVAFSLAGSDTGSGVDTLALNRGLFDTGSGTDSASVTIVLTPFAYDTGSGNDSSGVTIVETISAGDSGNGADAAVAVIPKPYFTPPTVKDIAPYLPDSSGLQVRLFRHYATRYRGVNVYLLSDGTFVQDTATPENANSGYPLPWILNNDPTKIGWNPPSYVNGQIVYGPEVSWPTGALPNTYSTVYNIDGTVTTTALSPYIAKIYEGSHTHAITQDEAVALMAAGYTVEYV